MFEENDHVDFRYQIVSQLGKGAFGIVVKALDHKYRKMVALKVVRNQEQLNKQA